MTTPPELVLVTRQGRLIGISVEGKNTGATVARDLISALAQLCHQVDERMGQDVRCACLPAGSRMIASGNEALEISEFAVRWRPVGIPFG